MLIFIHLLCFCLFLCLGCSFNVPNVFPTLPDKSNYVTEHHMVKMRDGVHLNTIVFLPSLVPEQKKAAVLIRTPYDAQGLKEEGEWYVREGYVAVMQDFRGRYWRTLKKTDVNILIASGIEGTFECWRSAAVDGYDTIRWIRQCVWSNGIVFSSGVSANGIAAYLEELAGPPGLSGQLITVATADVHAATFQQGAYRLSLNHDWLVNIKEPDFEKNYINNEAPGPYWDSVSLTNKWRVVLAPAIHVSGWYDIFNQFQLDAYEGYQTQSTIGQGVNFLIVLPTGHCPGGQISWPNAKDGVTRALELASGLFGYLSDDDSMQYVERIAILRQLVTRMDKMYWYVLGPGLPGTVGNHWTSAQEWPSNTSTSWFLTANGTLSSTSMASGVHSYLFDPHNPVATVGGNNLNLKTCGPWDQSELEKRPDVLVYTSAVLDKLVAVTGRMWCYLYVSSNATDTDFMVKVTDVFPNGTSMLVQDGAYRMRWRNNSNIPLSMTAETVYEIAVDVWSTSYIFNSGHRIRVSVSSSNYPRFSVNPNSGQLLNATDPQMFLAMNRVHFGSMYPSRLVLPVVQLEDLQPVDLSVLRDAK